MMEENKNTDNEQEISKPSTPTTRLLKRKGETEGETTPTQPLTQKFVEMEIEEEKRAKSGNGLIIGLVVVALAVVGVLLYVFVFSGGEKVFSGAANIDTYGNDSMDVNIVQGQIPTATTQQRALPRNRISRKRPVQKAAMPKNAVTNAPKKAINSSKPAVKIEKSEMAGNVPLAKPVEAPANAETKNVAIKGGTEAAPMLPPAAQPPQKQPLKKTSTQPEKVKKAISPSSSLAQGFKIKKVPKVKTGDLVPLTADVIKPKVIRKVNPKMPQLARQLRKTGRVIIRVLVDENGNVANAKMISEIPRGFGFGKAAMDVVYKMKFEPAKKDNVRVKVWETLFFSFR